MKAKRQKNLEDMRPRDIRIGFLLQGRTQSDLARQIGVSHVTISRAIDGFVVSHRIRTAIAEAVKVDIKRIWPSTYLYGGGPLKPGRPFNKAVKAE